ncbi:uncharacterized protein LOC124284451 [Haliotis rubra]|uniref:uncharacterized protein LOC124284451 n=1 Tax=Haliotis rubra TaxID=36100 RepID=UPI001EE5529A|nr:uncharacterized protein LOC124284451 [Haliotis rubra]
MGSLRITPVHVATWVFIVTVVSGIESQRKYCEVRMWYLDLVTDGPLAGELSEDKVILKAKIEKMMEKYKTVGRPDGKVDCHILTLYEELLRADDKPPEPPGGEKGSVDDPEQVKDRNDNESPRQIQTDKEKNETKEASSKSVSESTESSEDDTDLDETEFGDETDDETAELNESAFPSDTASVSVKEQEKADISKQETKTHLKQEDEPVKPKNEPKSDAKEDASQQTASKSGKKTRMVEDFVFDPLRGYVKVTKEVEIDDEEEKAPKEKQESDKSVKSDSDAKPHMETKITPPETETQSKEKNVQEEKVKVEETVSNEVILQSSEERARSELKVPQTLTSLQRIQSACLYKDQCELYCYYGFSNRMCLEHYPDIEYEVVQRFEAVITEPISESSKEETSGENAEERLSVTEMLQKNTLSQQESSVVSEANLDKSDPPEPLLGDGTSKGGDHLSQTQNDKKETDESEENPKDKWDKHIETTKEQIEERADEGSAKDTHYQGFQDFREDLHRFERQFQERASEYASKIQSLEIMIMKLENQLLGETITKQNDSNVLSRLENQILRLENDLLKLNQNYVTLKEENDILKARQGKYLKLGHDKANPNHPSLTDNSTKHYELITQQQSKISELSTILKNHSTLFNQLQSKSQHLEEQNQMLYHIVMNQTALISSVMKKMQDLSEEALRHRHETEQLKAKLEIKDNSDRILERLDNLVSGTPAISKNVVDDGKPEEKYIPNTLLSFFPKSPDAIVERRPWSCGGMNSSRFCVMYSLILCPCPPFSTVYWKKCPYFLKDISRNDTNVKNISEVTASESDKKDDPAAEGGFQTSHLPVSDEKESKDDILTKELKSDDTKTATEGTVGDSSSYDKQDNSKTEADSTKQSNDVTSPRPFDQAPAPETKGDETKTASEGDSSSKDTQENQPPKEEVDSVKQPQTPEKRKILYQQEGDTPKPRDCWEYYEEGQNRNGMYKIYLVGLQKSIPVYCDMRGGGWTILLKRSSSSIDFYKDWADYKKGFGGLYADHWIGNENLHYLTNQKNYLLRVDMDDFHWDSVYAEYDTFWTDNEEEGYRLHISGYSGTAGDSFLKHNNMKFSTRDVDNDLVNKELKAFDHNCAKRFHSGWWYYKCYMTNLTGRYYKKGVVPDKQYDGVSWKTWKGPSESLKEAVMKIRPVGVTA